MWTRRPVSRERSATAASSASEHHCGPLGPNSQLAQNVVVLVEGRGVDADREWRGAISFATAV